MSLPADREFRLPRRSRVPPWLWVVAIALHVLLVVVLISRRVRDQQPPLFDSRGIALTDSVPMVVLPRLRSPAVVRRAVPPPASAPANMPRVASSALPPAVATAPALAFTVDTPPTRGATDLRPHYGDGRLWVQPMPESPREIARALSGKSLKELTDSAVASMVQTYLDAMAREQAANPTALPSWTTKIGGKTVGLDSKWIYLGPIKIPTALLALLPINMTGNMSNYQYNKQLESMRSDLFDAARRAATYDDFKKAVKAAHDQSEQAREFKRNQRTAPDTSHHG